jgi:hypothetical protein
VLVGRLGLSKYGLVPWLECCLVEFDYIFEFFGWDVGLATAMTVVSRMVGVIVLFEDNDGEYGFRWI